MLVNNLGLNVPKELQATQAAPKDGSQLGKDEFMKLLMAEMKNQDPLSPKSNSESIAQMAQFSALEQSANLNSSFNGLAKNITMNNLASSAHVIGKYATVQNGNDEVSGKVVSTSIKDGEVVVKLKLENGEEMNAKMGAIIALSETQPEKKVYKALPSSEVVTEA